MINSLTLSRCYRFQNCVLKDQHLVLKFVYLCLYVIFHHLNFQFIQIVTNPGLFFCDEPTSGLGKSGFCIVLILNSAIDFNKQTLSWPRLLLISWLIQRAAIKQWFVQFINLQVRFTKNLTREWSGSFQHILKMYSNFNFSLCLLSEGRVAYMGPSKDAYNHFAK